MDKGWHINSSKPLHEYLKPTTISLENNPAVSVGEISYPVGKEVTFPFNADPLSVYEGEVWFLAPLTVRESTPDGEIQLDFEIRTQPCDEHSCRAPQTLLLSVPVEIDVTVKGGYERHQKIFEVLG
jgi:hypothetical protein